MIAHPKGVKGGPQLSRSRALSIDTPRGGELRGGATRNLVEAPGAAPRTAPQELNILASRGEPKPLQPCLPSVPSVWMQRQAQSTRGHRSTEPRGGKLEKQNLEVGEQRWP